MSAAAQPAAAMVLTGPAGKPLDRRGLYSAVPLAAGFLVGIALCSVAPVAPVAYATAAAVLASWVLLLTPRGHSVAVAVIGFGFAGVSLSQSAWYQGAREDIAYYSSDTEALSRLRLQLVEPPRTITSPHRPPMLYAKASVNGVRCRGGWRSATGVLLLRVSGKSDLKMGDEFEAIGSFCRLAAAGNPGEFDLQRYHRLQGTHCRFSCDSAAVRRLAEHGEGALGAARRIVRQGLARGFTGRQSDELALAGALLLGDSDASLGEVREDFRKTGTTHHLAISGTHISILTFFVYMLCRAASVRPARAATIGMAFALGYGLVVVPSPPVVRSVLLCLAIGLSLILRRRVQLVQLLCVAAVAMLVFSPLDAFSAGFQLSFIAVLALMLLANRLSSAIRNLESEHVRVARKLRPPRGWRAGVLWVREWAITMVSAGVVAWLVSMPLIAWHFRQLNPWAVPASILLGFVVATTLVAGLLKVVLTLLCPPLAALLAVPVALSAGWMRELVHAMAAVPATDAAVFPMPLWLMLGYYLCLLAPLVPSLEGRRRAWVLPLTAGVLASLLPLVAMARSHRDGASQLTCLAVGAGSCAVLESPGGAIMVDCGSSSPAAGDRIIRPFLRYRGLRQLDAVYLTHGDADHVSALDDLLEAGLVRRVVVPAGAEWAGAVCQKPAAAGAEVREVRRGEVLQEGQASVSVLGPEDAAGAGQPNDASLVLLVETGGRRILFTGDIGASPRQRLAQAQPPVSADILIAPHHGAVTPGTQELIERSGAALVVSSDAPRLSAGQKSLASLVAPRGLYRTGAQGAITVRWEPTGELAVRGFRGR